MPYLLFLTILLLISPAKADDFYTWLQQVKAEAAQQGIQPATLNRIDDIEFKDRVIELDQAQPEGTQTFDDYLRKTVTPERIEKGRALLRQHRVLLQKIGAQYGVQPRFIVALWGKETDYGRFTGGFNVLDALATLAYEGRRAAYFKAELINALHILDGGHIQVEKMRGSWAGAMGQCQFMPTSFFKYAADGDGDGRFDIWDDKADVFASTANYLRTEGWNHTQTWGRAVRLTQPIAESATGVKVQLTLTEWTQYGVTNVDGTALPNLPLNASLVQPDGPQGASFLVYDNFRVLLHWNRSSYFAVAVGMLADGIGY